MIMVLLYNSSQGLGPFFGTTVSFHNFKSQNFKLSVSNPESKYVAYVSVLFQISNCQSLGRKNKLEILKADRTCPKQCLAKSQILQVLFAGDLWPTQQHI